MASSSTLSQDSVEYEDDEFSSKITGPRIFTKSKGMVNSVRSAFESGGISNVGNSVDNVDAHEDSTSYSNSRNRDKKSVRPSHITKGKTPRDKRKLREKRRSTGVVKLNAESTGDEEGEAEEATEETKKNTTLNEDIDSSPAITPDKPSSRRLGIGNKSPSDLDADLEDNQDYDSGVNQSDSNRASDNNRFSSISSVRNPPPAQNRYGSGITSSLFGSRSRNGSAYPATTGTSSSIADNSTARPYSSTRLTSIGSLSNRLDSSTRPVTSGLSSRREPSSALYSRPFGSRYSSHGDDSGVTSSRDSDVTSKPADTTGSELAEAKAQIESLKKELEGERKEKVELRRQLDSKEKRVTAADAKVEELLEEVKALHQELDDIDEDNLKLLETNRALMQRLSVDT